MKKLLITMLALVLLLTSCGITNTPADIPDETPTEAPIDTSESSTPNQDVDNVGGSQYCDHDVVYNHGVQDGSFHSIPGNLIDYVGQDEFDKWIEHIFDECVINFKIFMMDSKEMMKEVRSENWVG